MITNFEGHNFLLPDNAKQLGIHEDEAALLKRQIDAKIAEFELTPDDLVLDAFSGVGFSAYLWAKKCETVCIEKDSNTFGYLEQNLDGMSNALLYNQDNVKVMKELSGLKFKLIDLDPHNNFHAQLEMVPKLLPKGILLLTSGEIFNVMRFASIKRFGDIKYLKGHFYYLFPDLVLIPYLEQKLGCQIEYFYVFPTSVRIVATVGGYQISSELKTYFKSLPKYLGRLGKENINQTS